MRNSKLIVTIINQKIYINIVDKKGKKIFNIYIEIKVAIGNVMPFVPFIEFFF